MLFFPFEVTNDKFDENLNSSKRASKKLQDAINVSEDSNIPTEDGGLVNIYAVIGILVGGVCLAAVAVVSIKLRPKLNNYLREEEANSVAFKI